MHSGLSVGIGPESVDPVASAGPRRHRHPPGAPNGPRACGAAGRTAKRRRVPARPVRRRLRRPGPRTRHRRRLILLDLRGTGDSAVPMDPTTYRCDQLVDDMEALRACLGVERSRPNTLLRFSLVLWVWRTRGWKPVVVSFKPSRAVSESVVPPFDTAAVGRGTACAGSRVVRSGTLDAEIARMLEVSDESVLRWKRVWEEGGTHALRRRPATGRPSKLDDAQVEQVRTALEQGAQAHGFEADLWTLERVGPVVEKLRHHRTHSGPRAGQGLLRRRAGGAGPGRAVRPPEPGHARPGRRTGLVHPRVITGLCTRAQPGGTAVVGDQGARARPPRRRPPRRRCRRH